MNAPVPLLPSPKWSSTTKLVVGLTIAGLVVALLIYFRSVIGPLLLAFVVTYLLHPVALRISSLTRLSWRLVVTLLYLLVVVVLAGVFTLTGLAVAQQLQSLFAVVDNFIKKDIPVLLTNLSSQRYFIGPFEFNLGQYLDFNNLSQQLINLLEPALRETGSLVSAFASQALSAVGWGLFVLIVSYFLLAEAGRFPDAVDYIQLPGYDADVRRMVHEIGRIWNAFLRGQLIIVMLVVVSYSLLMPILGMRFALGIAILAGVARFVPYLGPFVTWGITALVAVFQPGNYFGLEPLKYAILVVALALVLDQIFDNLISPQIFGSTLSVHPAAVLLVALLAAQLIGVIGLLVAAPVLATFKLISRYTVRKMFDLDPWEGLEEEFLMNGAQRENRVWQRLRAWWRALRTARR